MTLAYHLSHEHDRKKGIRIIMRIINVCRKVKAYYNSIIAPLDHDKSVGGVGAKIPFDKKIKYNLLGFTDKEINYYDLLNNDYHQYISAFERLKLENVNGRFADILGEKVMLERIWGNYIHVPKTYSLIKRGHYLDLSDEKEEADILSLLKEKGKLLAKPTRSSGGGHGVVALCYGEEKFFIGNVSFSAADFEKELRTYNDYMISEWIYPHEYARKVFSKTTNTIRIVTVMNHSTNKSEVLMAVQRFGTEKSIPVDNGCSGGIISFIDIKTGICEDAHDMIHLGMRYMDHPDTGEKVKGICIPNWDCVKEKMTHVHNCFPYYEFLAWDIVISGNGDIYVIEINRGMDVHWLQVKRPLRKEALGEYMRKMGLLREW